DPDEHLFSVAVTEDELRRRYDAVKAYWDELQHHFQLHHKHYQHFQLHHKHYQHLQQLQRTIGLFNTKDKPLGTAQASKKVHQQILRTNKV
ncbi:uncharacterized protein, partial [Chelonus insularis]|uniref:uncharacterized protein n=1 Tax=Chelonus insularis TaxID=460826 RepID=UPI0015885B77